MYAVLTQIMNMNKTIIFYQQKRKNVTFAPSNLSVAQLVEHPDFSREGHSLGYYRTKRVRIVF